MGSSVSLSRKTSARFASVGAALLLPALTLAAAGPGPPPAQTEAPWTNAAPGIIQTQALTFNSGGVHLHGTLYFPRGAPHCPTVIVLHGASSPSQDLPLYRHLEQLLPPLGLAAFVFDRRPTGSPGAHDFAVLAQDGVAAHRMLTGNTHVDGARTGYWGVSQGGWLALLAAAADPNAAFAIAVSAPMTTPAAQMDFAVANILHIHGFGNDEVQEALSARRAVDDYLRGKRDATTAQQQLDAASERPWFQLAYLDRRLPDRKSSGWAHQMGFDPLPTLERLQIPVLLIYGQSDPWVPVATSLSVLKTATREQHNVQVAVVEGADHTMMLAATPKDQVDPDFFPREAPDAPAYFALLGAWLTQNGFAHLR
jgi:uncharacterized protein